MAGRNIRGYVPEPIGVTAHIDGREMLSQRRKCHGHDDLHPDFLVLAQEQPEQKGPGDESHVILLLDTAACVEVQADRNADKCQGRDEVVTNSMNTWGIWLGKVTQHYFLCATVRSM